MAAAPTQLKTEFFKNKGLVLKQDPGQLTDGEYSELSNMVSVQEGAITVRSGDQRLTGGVTPSGSPQFAIIHSLAKLHGPTDYRYIGNSTSIFRASGPLPTSGASMSFTNVANSTADVTISNYTNLRWTGIRYNAGSIGTPYEFFACPGKMLKDTGTLAITPGDQYNNPPNFTGAANYGPGSDSTALQQWGILPPWQPAIAVLDQVTVLPANTDLVSTVATGLRINVTTSSFVWNTPSGTGPGWITITPSNMVDPVTNNAIQLETLLLINTSGGAVAAVVQNATTAATSSGGTFSCYLNSTANPTGSITAHLITETEPTTIPNIPAPGTPPNIDASFDGQPPDYVTDDLVHVAISVSAPANISDIRFRVFVGGTNSDGSGSDYYEQSISPNALQAAISGTTTTASELPGVLSNVNQGVYSGNIEQLLPTYVTELSPTSPLTSTSNVWTEIDTPKSQFTAVGNAGDADKTWKNVTGFQVFYVATGATTISVASVYIWGGFGPQSLNPFVNTEQLVPYAYVYTFRNPVTGAESNPSVPMISTATVSPSRQAVSVWCGPTGDPQIPTGAGAHSIAVYRSGGSFSDGFYRFVGYTSNTGFTGTGSSATPTAPGYAIFHDTVSDISIASAQLVSFDNDPPVTSTLPNPIVTPIIGLTGTAPGILTIQLIGIYPQARIGSTMHVTAGPASAVQNNEDVIIASVFPNSPSGETTMTFYAQYPHLLGDIIEIDAVSNQPCNLAVAAFDSVFVAGDLNNPHVLYKSKTGRPEYFPVVELVTGIADQINVGSPSDPIMNFTEFNGQLVCLNLSHIYLVSVFAGAMQAPVETPANRGLVATWAWCRADNEIWFLAYDGIYSWAGGQAFWRSAPVDPLFKGFTLGGPAGNSYNPIDMTKASQFTMTYYKNEIFLVYIDSQATYRRLRYNIPFNRWSIETLNDPLNIQNPPSLAITAQYVEPETGNYLLAKAIQYLSTTWSFLYLDDTGTSDGWVNAGNDGAVINYSATPATYTLGVPSVNKQFLDFDLEFNNDSSAYTVNAFYDFATSAGDTYSIAAGVAQGRRRLQESLQSGFGKEAYALTLQFTGSTTVPLTLYSLTWNYFPLNQLQVGRPMDWDDLGYPYDKQLYELVITHDIPSGSVTLNLDVETGINGSQGVTLGSQTFTLLPTQFGGTHPSNRITSNFPLADGTIVKRVRIRPTLQTTPFKIWDYKFNFQKYPPDIVPFTEWSDLGWPYEKVARFLVIDMNTNGIPCTIQVQADGVTVATFTATTTITDRERIIPFVSNIGQPTLLIGRLWRLVLTPGSGGMAQVFSVGLDYVPDAAAISFYDTLETNFGIPLWKAMKQGILNYWSSGPLTVTFFVENATQFYQITLPAHPNRTTEKFYFPASNNGVLNKAKVYRIQFSTACPGGDGNAL